MSALVNPNLFGTAAGTTFWDSADKSANMTLSGGNLIATATGTAAGVRVNKTKSTGKWYVEHLINPFDASDEAYVGIMTSTWPVGGVGGFTGDSERLVLGHIGEVNGPYGTVEPGGIGYLPGDIVSMSVDLDNNRVWFKVNAGNWNGNGAANPSTNTGGFQLTGGLPMRLYVYSGFSGASWSTKFESGFTYTVPSGFSGWT